MGYGEDKGVRREEGVIIMTCSALQLREGERKKERVRKKTKLKETRGENAEGRKRKKTGGAGRAHVAADTAKLAAPPVTCTSPGSGSSPKDLLQITGTGGMGRITLTSLVRQHYRVLRGNTTEPCDVILRSFVR